MLSFRKMQSGRLKRYVKSRNISGGEILLVKQFMNEGKSNAEIDFALLDYGSEGVTDFLFDNAVHQAEFEESLARAIEAALKDGTSFSSPEKTAETAKELERDARFLKDSLNKIFLNLKERR